MTVWVLLTFLANGQPKVQLAFKSKAACEHMIAELSDPTKAVKSSIVGYQCIEVPVEND